MRVSATTSIEILAHTELSDEEVDIMWRDSLPDECIAVESISAEREVRLRIPQLH